MFNTQLGEQFVFALLYDISYFHNMSPCGKSL